MEEEEISLGELFAIIKNKLVLIISLSIAGLLLSALYTFFVVTPMYESTTQLLVNRAVDENVGIQLNDINTNVRMIDTYKDIIRGPVILEDVKANLDTNLTVSEIREMVNITANENSQVFSLTITSEDPVAAANIANEIATTFQNNISDIMNVENVSIISEANVNPNAVSPNIPMNLVLGVLVGMMLGVGIAFLQHFMDNTIKGSQFINEHIGWTDLGTISVLSQEDKESIEEYLQSQTAKSNRRSRVI
ncbi:YveK family protein [Jeotgalibaca sp. A122]|uniref:YveK family protein n=1 Tax=Jeotgalibaca sp. A122 TaxID=3457322 RepID=UPI003FD36941